MKIRYKPESPRGGFLSFRCQQEWVCQREFYSLFGFGCKQIRASSKPFEDWRYRVEIDDYGIYFVDRFNRFRRVRMYSTLAAHIRRYINKHGALYLG